MEAATKNDLIQEALGQSWYHTIDIAEGRTTSGAVDHRPQIDKLLPLPLEGKRCLDVGTFDGFFAYTMERRGATSVHAVDLASFDDTDLLPRNRRRLEQSAVGTPGDRFRLLHQILGSQVEYVQSRIYDLTPDQLGGPVDFAVVSDLLLHLRDPIGGLEAVRSCIKPDGHLMLSEEVSLIPSILYPRRSVAFFQGSRYDYNWWKANYHCLHDWLHQAGYVVERRAFFRLKAIKGQDQPHVTFIAKPDPGFVPSWEGPRF